ncbi:MAG: nSTAND1 domain-containing NTPase [Nocardioides sp.]
MGVAVLGRLEVDESDGGLGPRDRVVLSVLALAPGEVVSADRLADALWRDELPATWTKVVQGCVMRLRKVLGSQAIETSRHGYRLVLPSDEIDARRFERLVGRGRELLSLAEPERAGYVLGEAMALWRGPAFMELDGWDTSRVECERLDELRRNAEELGIEAELRAGRAREVVARAQALVSQAPLRERRWSLLALAQYQAGRQSDALHSLREVRRLLGTELGLDPGPEVVALEEAILRQDPTLVARTALAEPSQTCPYLGLVPYDVADGDAFFGRDADVAQCLRRLAEQGVLVVVGPSGSGKSSLVRAGVAAALERDGRRLAVIAPGAHPMDVMTAVPSKGRRPVVVVDQLEEAVTLCGDTPERGEFFRALVEHAEAEPLIVALRADHMSDLTAYPAFARLVERGLYLLGDMEEVDLRACIEGPALHAGLLLEPGLVDLLVREVEGEPGALPLLSHSLRQTWANREGRTLTVSGYVATGGIRGAVSRTAEEVYARVEPAQRDLMRDLMLRLVVPSADGDPVRNRMPRRLVATDTEHDEVIEQLVSARLVTSDEGVLVLAHEAVARAWPRLQQWLEEDTEGQRILRHLPVAADTWESMGRPDSELYRGSRLARAVEWRERTRPKLSPVEREFVDASTALADAELEAARDRANSEASARRRTRRLAAGLAVALILTVVAAVTATYFQQSASERAGEADANRLAALSKSVGELDLSLLLAAHAAQMANTSATQDGLLSSIVQHRRATQVVQLGAQPDDVELAADGRVMFVSRGDGIDAWDVGSTSGPHPVNDWHYPADIGASSSADAVALWAWPGEDPVVGVFGADGTERLHLVGEDEIGGWPQAFGFRPHGRRLLIALATLTEKGWRSTVGEVDVATGQTVRSYATGLTSSGEDEWVAGKIADDGSSAVSWTETDATAARRLDLHTGSSVPIRVGQRPARSLGFVPLTTGAAQTWSDGALTLYDTEGRASQVLEVHQASVNDVVVAPDGTWAATVDGLGAVVLWSIDPATGTWSQRESLVGHTGAVTGVAVDPDGRTLVTVSRDGTAITWDVSAAAGFGSRVAGIQDRWISNTPATIMPGELIVAPTRPAPPDGVEFLGDPGTLSVFATFLNPSTGEVVDDVRVARNTVSYLGSSVSVSPDGSAVAVTHGFGATVLDTGTREVLARIRMPRLDDRGAGREMVWASAWSPDGSRLMLGPEGNLMDPTDGGLMVVDTDTWRPAVERVDIGGSVQSFELSPDQRLLAVAMAVGPIDDPPPAEIRLLDADTLEVKQVLTVGAGDQLLDVSFSPDGGLLASGGAQGKLSVVDVTSGRVLHTADPVHNGQLTQVEWLPDGRTVVTTGTDGMVSLYDAERGLARVAMPASAEPGDGYTYLLSLSEDEVTATTGAMAGRTYPLDPNRWLAYACLVAGRDLTEDEWASYLGDLRYERTCEGIG